MEQPGLKMNRKRFTRSIKGNAAFDTIVFTMVIIFVIFPVFSVICEKYIVVTEAQSIKDAVDMTNIAVYNSMNNEALGRCIVDFDDEDIVTAYKKLLAVNLKLNADLSPKPDSIAEGQVTIDSLICYTDNLPVKCTAGNVIKRPTIHSLVTVPVKPVLYRQLIFELTGKEYLELKVHVDSELPVNN